jgi:vitamin B12 transporter
MRNIIREDALGNYFAGLSVGLSTLKPALLLAVLGLALLVSPARGEDEELRSLEVYNGAQTELVSANRSLRPASQTAENITVVTAREIEALNAHTLADILAGVNGIQLEMFRTPGTGVNIEIQGSNFNHVLVLIDDVPINNLGDNFPDIASIPAQMIERVEIVKGAASTTWGSALGGVINVITKSPLAERPFAGLVSGSLGRRITADARAEATGTLDRFGYYLSGGLLRSDGLQPNNGVNKRNVYGKLHYELPVHGGLTLSALYTDGSSGQTAFAPDDIKANQKGHQLVSTLSLQYPLADNLLLEASARVRDSFQSVTARVISDNTVLGLNEDDELTAGGSLKLSWLNDLQRIVAGVDYDHEKLRVSSPLIQVESEQLKRSAERIGFYLNDTFTLGGLALIPSARYDHTGTGGDLFSPSFGLTYALTDNTVLRGYTSRGYSLTSLNRDNSTERVWTSQVGVESGDLPYLWLKGTFLRNDTWNIGVKVRNPAFDPNDPLSIPILTLKKRQLKQGFEVEARTLPVFNTSLSTGYTYIHATDGDSGAVIRGVPRHTVDFGVKYQDRGLRALLTARYLDWNGHMQNGSYSAVIWDLHLGKTFQYSEHGSVELFLSVRNLFNGDQYLSEVYKNPGRWGEAGVRCNF